MIIDAKDLIMGRIASYCAKQALLGNDIIVINVDKAVVSGSKVDVLAKYKWKNDLGEPFKGPFFPKTPMKFFKRVIRGMLSYKKGRGKEAFKRIKCYPGNPSNVNGITFPKLSYTKLNKAKYTTVGDLRKKLKAVQSFDKPTLLTEKIN